MSQEIVVTGGSGRLGRVVVAHCIEQGYLVRSLDRAGRPAEPPAKGVIFRRTPADQFLAWHPAPRRQYVITLSGAAEVEASDGEVRLVGPGTIMLADDTTGKGHITRSLDPGPRATLLARPTTAGGT